MSHALLLLHRVAILVPLALCCGCGILSSADDPNLLKTVEEWERSERQREEEYEKRRKLDPNLPPYQRVHGGVI